MSKDNLSIGLVFYLRPHLGGSGIMTLELAKPLRKRDHDVTLISYPKPTIFADDFKSRFHEASYNPTSNKLMGLIYNAT